MPRGRKPDLQRRRLAAELRSRGLTLREIGRRLGVSRQAAHQLVNAEARRKPDRQPVCCLSCGVEILPAGTLSADSARRPVCLPCLDRRPGATFGQRLRSFRLAVGLTMADLDRRAGLPGGTTNSYERGARRPQPANLARLARALGVGAAVLGAGGMVPGKRQRGK